MDAYLTNEILRSLISGDITRSLGYVAIFFIIWREVRGMKTELKNLNVTVAKSFAEGEKRFDILEGNQKTYEHRLTMLEKQRG